MKLATHPTKEEKNKILRKANKLIDGEILMRKYKELSKKHDEIIPIARLMGNEKWKDIKDRALPEQALTLEAATKVAKEALEWSGKDELTIISYEEYRKKVGGPSASFVQNKMRWSTFKANFTDSTFSTEKEIIEKDLEENFCEYCNEQNDCDIELESCKYWRGWNENQRKSFG